jgi:DNA-binding protein HU-beta
MVCKILISYNTNTMNKTELVNAIAQNAGLTKADAKKALDATIEAIAGALKNKESVALLGFGTFSVNERPERQGLNPATKQAITIPAKNVVKFKAGSELDKSVN